MPVVSPYSFRRFLEPDVFPRGPVEDEEELEMLNRLRMIAEGYGPKPQTPDYVTTSPEELERFAGQGLQTTAAITTPGGPTGQRVPYGGPDVTKIPLLGALLYLAGLPQTGELEEDWVARQRLPGGQLPGLAGRAGYEVQRMRGIQPPPSEPTIRPTTSAEERERFLHELLPSLAAVAPSAERRLGQAGVDIGSMISLPFIEKPIQAGVTKAAQKVVPPIAEQISRIIGEGWVTPGAEIRRGAPAADIPPQVRRFLEEETGAAKIPKEPDLPLPRTPEEVANLPDASLPRLIQQLKLGSQADVLQEIASLRGNASQKAAEGDVEAARYLRREAALKRDSVNSAIIERIEQGVPAPPTRAEVKAAAELARQTAEPKPAEGLLRKQAQVREPTISFPKEPAPAVPPAEPTILPSVMPKGLDKAGKRKYITDAIQQYGRASADLVAPDPLTTPRFQYALVSAALKKPQSEQAAWRAYQGASKAHDVLVEEAVKGPPIDTMEELSTKEMVERVKEVYRQRERVLPEILAEHPDQSLARIVANKEPPYGWDKRIKWGKAEVQPESAKLPQPVPVTPAITPARGMGEDVLIKGPAVEAPMSPNDFAKLHGGKKPVLQQMKDGTYSATMQGSTLRGTSGVSKSGAITDLHDKLSGRAGRVSEKLPPAPKIKPTGEAPSVTVDEEFWIPDEIWNKLYPDGGGYLSVKETEDRLKKLGITNTPAVWTSGPNRGQEFILGQSKSTPVTPSAAVQREIAKWKEATRAAPVETAPEAPAGAAPLPEWLQQNKQAALDFADKIGVTPEIERLAREGKTAKEIEGALDPKFGITAEVVRVVRDRAGIAAAGPQESLLLGRMPSEGIEYTPRTAPARPGGEPPVTPVAGETVRQREIREKYLDDLAKEAAASKGEADKAGIKLQADIEEAQGAAPPRGPTPPSKEPPPPGGGLPEVPEGPIYEQPAAARVPETSPKRSAARADRARKQQQRAHDIINPENNVVKTEPLDADGGKVPPGGGRRPPTPPSPDGEPLTYPDDFTRLRDAIRVRDVDQELFDVSLQNGMKIEDPAKPFITPWSRALWSIITPSTSYDRRLRLPIFSSENYMKSQGTHTGMRRSAMFEIAREAFGTVTDKKIGWLERLYRGPEPTSDVLKDKVGTLWHALDQSEHYDLSPIQREAVQAWQEMLDAEMKFSRRNGVSSGMVEGIWVGRMVKAASGVRLSDESLSTAGLSLYQRGMFKKRRLDLEGFAKAVDHYNTAHPDAKLDIDTDLAKILSRRLMSTANARGEQIFIRSAAHNAGGRLLTGKHTTHQGESLVMVRSGNQTQRWAFPANIANQVQQVVGGTIELPTEKAIKSVMENVAGSILNVDASVMGLRQAFLAIKADPVDALRGYGEAVQGWLNPHYRAIWLANNWEGMARAQLDGLELTITPTDIAKPLEYSPKRIFVDRLPIVGQINEFSFDVLMPILKYKRHQANLATLHAMRDGVNGGILKANFVENIIRNVPGLQGASRKVGKSIQDLSDQELRRVAADAANNYLGGVDWTKIGQRGAARQVLSRFMLLTEGWMRAQVNMLKNASTLTAEGAMARRLLLQDISATALLSSAMSVALTSELPEFDPRDSHWLDVKTPWGYFTISPNKVLLRTVARVIAGPPPTATGRIDDPFSERYRALWQWFDGKQGPGVRQIVEQVGGKTFTGEVIPDDPISRAVNVLRAYSPILVQQVAKEQVDYRSDTQSAAARIAGEALGAGTQPYSAYQRATQDLSRSTPKELFTYNNAPTIVGREIARGNTELADTIKTYLQTKVKAARERTEKEKDLVQKFEQTEPRLAAAARSEVDRLRDLLAAQDPDLLSHLRSQREIRLDFDPEKFMVSRSKFTPLPRSSKGKLLTSWGKDATKDYWADVMGKRWDVDAGSDKKVAYMELPIAGRLEVDEFIARLDEMTVKKYNAQGKTEWRTLPSKAKTAIQNAVKKPSSKLFEPEPLKR